MVKRYRMLIWCLRSDGLLPVSPLQAVREIARVMQQRLKVQFGMIWTVLDRFGPFWTVFVFRFVFRVRISGHAVPGDW